MLDFEIKWDLGCYFIDFGWGSVLYLICTSIVCGNRQLAQHRKINENYNYESFIFEKVLILSLATTMF